MKAVLQAVSSALALLGLLSGVASHATNLAERPLKASVLAKPIVIFGMDDSSSMDTELMLYNNDGAFWWDYNAKAGWGTDAAHPNPAMRTITTTKFNAVGDANAQWRKMTYLFPNGTGAGNRILTDSQYDHFAVMPTTEFAFLRWAGVYKDTDGVYKAPPTAPELSPYHNPIYYNTLTTYKPWAQAQLSSGSVTPTNASTTSAKSHPVNGSSTFNLTANIAQNTGDNYVFTALPGMTVPNGAKKKACNSTNGGCPGSWTDVTADEAASNTGVTRVAMAYYAPTFWVKEACTVPATKSVGTDDCAYAPDGTTTLKRYEIKSGNTFPSGRSYTDELQNFANWFQYHRKRRLMLAGAMGGTMENLTGMRLGVVPFNSRNTASIYDADSTDNTKNRLRIAGTFYEAEGNGGTPTRETLAYIGEQFKRTDKDSTTNAYNVVQYSCQRNNAFIVTDGFANASSLTMPGYDSGKSAGTYGTGAPYETIFSSSLADLALRYYTNNPRSDLTAGKLQPTTTDLNTDLHMNTYGLTLGARGTLFFGESTAAPTTTGAWPNPSANRNPTSVDDLWHATINGRGKMYLATTPDETALRIQAGLTDILNVEGSQSSVAVSSVNLDKGDSQAYLGAYTPAGWSGDLTANPIDATTGAVSATANWSAATLLGARVWSTRHIFSSSASGGLDFDATNFGAATNPDSATFTNAQVIEYLRGNRTGEGSLFRTRKSLMGAVVNAEPVLARDEKMVYVASGEGMVHGFDTVTGAEQWAYVPPDTLANIGKSVKRDWTYQTLLDATPRYGALSDGTKILTGGLGAAGRSYYALNVTSPKNLGDSAAAAQFRWIFPAATDTTNRANTGYTIGRPVVTKVGGADVVLVTSGVDNGYTIGDGRGRLWVLNASTGAVIKTFKTLYGTTTAEAGLTHVSAFKEPDGSVRYAYGGDLLGNVWRFDLTATGAGEINGELLASLKDASNNAQPVTTAPELVWIGGKRIVLVGTGRLLDLSDFGSTRVQSFYAIGDTGTTSLTNARSTLIARTYNRGANGSGTFTVPSTAFSWDTSPGWYFDLPAGEQDNTDPILTYGAVAFVTNVNGASDCAQSSYLYLVDVTTGDLPPDATTASWEISNNSTSSRVITLRKIGGDIVGTTHKSDNSVFQEKLPLGTTIKPSKNAWREIRR
jgi:type IV pilus assembly protein PilY1